MLPSSPLAPVDRDHIDNNNVATSTSIRNNTSAKTTPYTFRFSSNSFQKSQPVKNCWLVVPQEEEELLLPCAAAGGYEENTRTINNQTKNYSQHSTAGYFSSSSSSSSCSYSSMTQHEMSILQQQQQQQQQQPTHAIGSTTTRCTTVPYNPNDYNKKDHCSSSNTTLRNHQSTQTMTLSTRIQMETCKNYIFFSLLEDFDSTLVHIQQSFAPTHCCGLAVVLRWIWCHTTYRILILDHRDALVNHNMCNLLYFGHLTNVTLIMTWTYQCLSTFLSTVAWLRPKHWMFRVIQQQQQQHQSSPDLESIIGQVQYRPSAIVCITWCIYSVSLVAEFIVAIGYWTFEYDPAEQVTGINYYKHGIIGCLLLLDGNVIGRIPLRIKHWRGVLVYGILYLIWSMVVSYLKLGRRHGIIYSFMDWRDDPEKAAGIGFFLLFLLGPLVYGACWLISLSDGIFSCCCGCCGGCSYCGSYNGRRRRVTMYNWNHTLVDGRMHDLEKSADSSSNA
jgi:hypothetical protein